MSWHKIIIWNDKHDTFDQPLSVAELSVAGLKNGLAKICVNASYLRGYKNEIAYYQGMTADSDYLFYLSPVISLAAPGLIHEFKAESCKEHPDFSGLEARHFYDIK
jgi:hypothetical protein